jgi:hypothetical protein
MALGVLAYPTLHDQDFELIQSFRKDHDELYYQVVHPHFAFVFPMDTCQKGEFLLEVAEKAQGFSPIHFNIRCATINKDSFLDYYHLLLVPDEGYSQVVKLHDSLYSGLFFPELRLDIDFIPHLGIANSKDKFLVKKWADQWNARDFTIKGSIDKLTVIEYDGKKLIDLKDISL